MTDYFTLTDGPVAHAALAGGAAGLGVALPLGAVGVLLLEEGRRGWRPAASAASAVALADLLYAALAVTVGSRVATALADWEVWTRAASAALLGLIAARGLLSLRRSAVVPPVVPPVVRAVVPPAGGDRSRAARAAPAFVRFLLLTLVNPTTALYFVALVSAGGPGGSGPGGSGAGAPVVGAPAGAAFALGVFAASLVWQQTLAGLGALAGARLVGRRARTLTYGVGYGLVAYYAVRSAMPV
ncbi:lysine transporter LysE [Kitasatospora sp. NPDC057015]|uniref:lysine transporter LysE n=1 Tax=Kitasatospora sp. NPDC057015 TaxID=3346001 RepID=UPI0036453F6F